MIKLSYLIHYRYFHGDLILNSYDGYGTDAVVYLKTQTHEANELLPIFNKTSTRQYKSAVPIADWTDPSFCVNRGIYGRSTAGGGGGSGSGGSSGGAQPGTNSENNSSASKGPNNGG